MNDKTKLILAIGILIIIFFTINKILIKLGIVKSAKQLEQDKLAERLETNKYFNPLTQKKENFKKLSVIEANTYAERLHKAIKGFGTDEESVYSIFSTLPNKNSISQISEAYYLKYNKDLLSDINNDLNTKEKAKLQSIINNLPEV